MIVRYSTPYFYSISHLLSTGSGHARSCKCCQDCKLRSAALCSPVGNSCCTESCEYKRTSSKSTCTLPTGQMAYCSNGVCMNDVCQMIGPSSFCGIQEANPCRALCTYQGECKNFDNVFLGGIKVNHIAGRLLRCSTLA